MSEPELSQLARDFIAAFNAGAWNKQHDALSADATYREFATEQNVQGADEIVEVLRGWKQAFQDLKATVTSLATSDDSVIAELVWRGIHTGFLEGRNTLIPAFGNRMTLPAVLVLKFDGASISEARHYFDLRSVLSQVGATPPGDWRTIRPLAPAQKWHVWAQTGWAT